MDAITYRSTLATYVGIATHLLEEDSSLSDERLADALHEWVSAPDGPFSWHDGSVTSEDIALDILRYANNRHCGSDCDVYQDGVVTAGAINFEFLAAHALVADVIARVRTEATTPTRVT